MRSKAAWIKHRAKRRDAVGGLLRDRDLDLSAPAAQQVNALRLDGASYAQINALRRLQRELRDRPR